MTTRRDSDVVRRFAERKAAYAETVPLAASASSPGQLLDTLVKDRRSKSPTRSYRDVMLEIMAEDKILAELYAL
jgi:hypothetical protein